MSLITKRRLASLATAIGHRRHDGRGNHARGDLCGRPAPLPASTATAPSTVTARSDPGRDRHRRRSTRPAATSASTSTPRSPAALPTPTSPARSGYGVVANGVDRQRDQQQGPPTSATSRSTASQQRPCHHLYQRRERQDQRQPGLRLPEERDRGHQPGRRWRRSLQRHDLRDDREERRHRPRVAHHLHRPERHRDQERRERHREEQHRQRLQLHAGRDTEATWPAALSNEVGTFAASGNKFAANEVNIYDANGTRQAATSSPNLRPHNTDRGLHTEAPVFLRLTASLSGPYPRRGCPPFARLPHEPTARGERRQLHTVVSTTPHPLSR